MNKIEVPKALVQRTANKIVDEVDGDDEYQTEIKYHKHSANHYKNHQQDKRRDVLKA